jgi:hypothetical protein
MGTHDCMSEREALAYVAHRVDGMLQRSTLNGAHAHATDFERGRAYALVVVSELLSRVREDFER